MTETTNPNANNARLFLVAKSSPRDAEALRSLRSALTRFGCSVYVEIEHILQEQLGEMIRNAASFEDLSQRLSDAGHEFLTTRCLPGDPFQRNDRELDSARSRLDQDYRGDIEGIVDDIRDEISSGRLETLDDLNQYIHETVEGTQRVIYTVQAKEALLLSDNCDAWTEYYQPPQDPRDSLDWSAMAYWVVRQDVSDCLGEVGYNEDAFDLLRASAGFERTVGDVMEVLGIDSDLGEGYTEIAAKIRCKDGKWFVKGTDFKLREEDVLELFLDYEEPDPD